MIIIIIIITVIIFFYILFFIIFNCSENRVLDATSFFVNLRKDRNKYKVCS